VSGLVYVYALVAAEAVESQAGQAAGLSGIEQEPVSFLVEGPLAAAVSDVDAADFDERPLNERVRDLQWLGPRAVSHQRVNAQLFERSEAVLPLAFGTVFRDDQGVRRLLREQRSDFLSRLDHVRGSAEWVLTVHRDDAAALASLEESSAAVRDLREQVAAGSPGRAYLLKRRLEDARRQELIKADAEIIQDIFASLDRHVEDTFHETLPPSVENGPMARASVLVRRAVEGSFLHDLEQARAGWQERGYAVSATGPWPPYRFGGLEPASADAAS